MRIKSGIGLLMVVWLLVVVSLPWGAGAQGPVDRGQVEMGEDGTGAGVLGGIGQPPPTGYSVLYMFTGAAYEVGNGQDRATAVHCTNFHPSASVDVRIELWNYNGTGPYIAGTDFAIASGHTRTYVTGAILAYHKDGVFKPDPPDLVQGSGRVLVKQHSQVICTAQVLDANADPPVYAVRLTLFDKYGRIVHQVRRLYLPMIRKS